MRCKGIVKGNVVLMEKSVQLPDGSRITVTVEQEEQIDEAVVTREDSAQHHVLGAQIEAFGQRLAGEARGPRGTDS